MQTSLFLICQNYMCLQLLSPPGNNSINFLYRRDDIGKGTVYFKIQYAYMHTRFISPTVVTCMPLDDATLTTETRDLITQALSEVNSLPR